MLLSLIARMFPVRDVEKYIRDMENYGALTYYKYHLESPPLLDYPSNITRIHGEIMTEVQEKIIARVELNKEKAGIGDLEDFCRLKSYREIKKYVQKKYLDNMHKKLYHESFTWSNHVRLGEIKNKALMLIAANRLGLSKLKMKILESVKIKWKSEKMKIRTGMEYNGNIYYQEFVEFYFLLNEYVEDSNEFLMKVMEKKIKTFVDDEAHSGIKISVTDAFKQFILDLKPERRYGIANRLQKRFKIVDKTNLKYFIEDETVDIINNWYCGILEDPFKDFKWTRGMISLLLDNSCLEILTRIPKKYLVGYLLHATDIVVQDILYKRSELLDIIFAGNLKALRVFLLKNEKYNDNKKILEWIILNKEIGILNVFLETTLIKEVDGRVWSNLEIDKRISVGKMLRNRNIDIKTDNLKDIGFIKKYKMGNKLIVNRMDFEYIEYCAKNSLYEYMECIYESIEDAKLLDGYLLDNHYDFYINFLCYSERVEEIEELIRENYRLTNSSILIAVREGNLEITKLLVENGLVIKDSDLLELTKEMKPEILEYLLLKAANYDINKLKNMWTREISPKCMEVLIKEDILPEKNSIGDIFKSVTVEVLKKLEKRGYEWNDDCFNALYNHKTPGVFEYLLNAGFKPRKYSVYTLQIEVLIKILPLLYEKGFYEGGKEDKPGVGILNSEVADKLYEEECLESIKYLAERNIHPT